MSLEAKVRKRIEHLLLAADDRGVRGPRLLDDAQRLWRHASFWIDRHLVSPDCDKTALELACHAIQLPLRQRDIPCVGRYGQINLRERAEQAAEELVSEYGDSVDEKLLERTTDLLHDVPARSPAREESKLLADVLNLDDFGVSGMINQTLLLAAMGQGMNQLIEASQKRDAYGYWEARIKDGFHFGPTRELAKRRLARARQFAKLLEEETKEHGG
jgi:hypothetical protein